MQMQWIEGRRKAALLLVLTAALLAAATPTRTQDAAYPELDQQLEPLRAQFNADAGKVRLLLIMDPT